MDLYEILKVAKTGKPKDIKLAYRTLVKTHHPDAGGEAAEFDKITRAYKVLMDPVKRKFYDEHGFVAEIAEDEIEKRTYMMLEELVNNLLDSSDDKELVYFDVIGELKTAIEANISEICAQQLNVRKEQKKLEKYAEEFEKRLKKIEGGRAKNFFAKKIREKKDACVKDLQTLEEQLITFRTMLEFAGEFEYNYDEKPETKPMQFNTTHTNGTLGSIFNNG